MGCELLSLGLDVGTSTTQLVLSRLRVENKASSFAVPELTITERQVVYRSPVYLTPLVGEMQVDGEKIREIVAKEYENAGITREQVDTGAIIVTGESSRKENARQVLDSLSGFAGDFVVATAGPDLESVLAARGSGAVAFSEETGKTVLHMDIGGGTSNLSLIKEGVIQKTGCLNVGGRLLKFGTDGAVTYVSPVLTPLTTLRPGDRPEAGEIKKIIGLLVQALEMAAGLRPETALLDTLSTREAGAVFRCKPGAVLSFSGGVADCIGSRQPPGAYGDIGPELGQAIRQSLLCRGEYRLGQETIGATVIGAGCHSLSLSGSTVYCKNVELPLKNLPVVPIPQQEQLEITAIRARRKLADSDRCLYALPGFQNPSYEQVRALAQVLGQLEDSPLLICTRQDMAKALGQCLGLLHPDRPCLCMDGLGFSQGDYLDVGKAAGPAFPVVIKTIILSK